LKELSDGDTLMAAGIWFQIWGAAEVRNRFLPWALGGETDWRNAANDWVDGKIWGCKGNSPEEEVVSKYL